MVRLLHSFGVSTARYVAGIPSQSSPYVIYLPLGPSIVRWDVQKKERTSIVQPHEDLITCFIKSPAKVSLILCKVKFNLIEWRLPYSKS